MRKVLCALAIVVLCCSAGYAASRWRAPDEQGHLDWNDAPAAEHAEEKPVANNAAGNTDVNSARVETSGKFDPYYDTTRVNDPDAIVATALDAKLHEGFDGEGQIISSNYVARGTQPGEYQGGKGVGREHDEDYNYSSKIEYGSKINYSSKVSDGDRNYQTGFQEWGNNATRQLINWKFSPNEVIVELFKKDSTKPLEKYSMKPYRKGDPYSGFVFTWSVAKGTQIVVPEGCEIHCNPATVDLSTRTDDDKRGAGIAFSEGDVILFKKSVSPGFTIFPYHAWPLD